MPFSYLIPGATARVPRTALSAWILGKITWFSQIFFGPCRETHLEILRKLFMSMCPLSLPRASDRNWIRGLYWGYPGHLSLEFVFWLSSLLKVKKHFFHNRAWAPLLPDLSKDRLHNIKKRNFLSFLAKYHHVALGPWRFCASKPGQEKDAQLMPHGRQWDLLEGQMYIT